MVSVTCQVSFSTCVAFNELRMQKTHSIKVALGSMTFGGVKAKFSYSFVTFPGSGLDQQKSQAVVNLFARTGFDEIDTAILYQQGKTEKLLGQMVVSPMMLFDGQGVGKKYKIAAKVNSHFPKQSPSAGLSKENFRKQFEISLKNLKMSSVSEFEFIFVGVNCRFRYYTYTGLITKHQSPRHWRP